MRKRNALLVAFAALAAASGCTTLTDRELVLADQHRDLAATKLVQGESEAAITEYRRSLEINPKEPETHIGLAEAYRKKGLLSDTERALKTDRANYTAHLDLGIVLYDRGDLVDAIQHFEECVSIVGERPALVFGSAEAEARFRMAQAYVRLNQRDRAVASLRVAVERGGESEWARKSSDYLKVLQ